MTTPSVILLFLINIAVYAFFLRAKFSANYIRQEDWYCLNISCVPIVRSSQVITLTPLKFLFGKIKDFFLSINYYCRLLILLL